MIVEPHLGIVSPRRAEQAFERSVEPLRAFMLKQTRETDIALFMKLARHPGVATPEELPFRVLVPAFVTSELKTAFRAVFERHPNVRSLTWTQYTPYFNDGDPCRQESSSPR